MQTRKIVLLACLLVKRGEAALQRAPVSRRRAIGGAFGAAIASRSPAFAADAEFERVIAQQQLLSALASAPVRDVVITGANSGVGLAGAKLLTAAGHRVTLACRTQAKADAAAAACTAYAASTDKFFSARREGGVATGAECNLASMQSVRAFAESLKEQRIDSLVLNAGLAHGQADTEPFRTLDGFEETVGVNHLGHFYLAKLLAPTLAKAPDATGRLVVTASPVHDPKSGGGDGKLSQLTLVSCFPQSLTLRNAMSCCAPTVDTSCVAGAAPAVGAPATLGDLTGLASGASFTMSNHAAGLQPAG